MFSNQTLIGRVVAHCPERTEPVLARLRLSHLLESADFTPIAVPPQAILVVRRIASPAISLSSFRLNSAWQRALRENIARLHHGAVRPTRGVVPEDADAVLFADIGEWLACFAVAVRARQVEQAWYWRASLRNEAISSSRTLARLWSSKPRFVPAAIAHLAEWRCVDSVLKLFSSQEAGAIFTALADEWNLPKSDRWLKQELANTDRIKTNAKQFQQVDRPAHGSAEPRSFSQRSPQSGTNSSRVDHHADMHEQTQAPWKPWLPALARSCEALPLETQRLLAISVALFHAPAIAPSANFAAEISRWLFALAHHPEPADGQMVETAPAVTAAQFLKPESSVSRESVRTSKAEPRNSVDDFEPAGSNLKQKSAAGSALIGNVKNNEARAKGKGKKKHRRFWQDLSGFETKIGGVLFLVNLLQETRLPECFDEEFDLSLHISGWGFVELLGKALLGDSYSDFEQDTIWTVLQVLDGREPGEEPGVSLPETADYRMPVHWLKRFVVSDEPWSIASSPGRLRLCHRSGGFAVVDCALGDLTVAARAASELKRYHDQGITAELEQPGSLDAEFNVPFLSRMQTMPGWADLSGPMRRWMTWTFPFLHHLLLRTLGEESNSPEALARLLLQKSGTLYCTATHVDLVMRMDQIVMPVRLAGLDSNPGWQRDLMRVVSFHFE